MNKCNMLDDIFKLYDIKHLPVVERMIIDINRRVLKEKSSSLTCFHRKNYQESENSKKTKNFESLRSGFRRCSLGKKEKSIKYKNLEKFYERLEQDIKKRNVRSKIRLQIKKILDKRKYTPRKTCKSSVWKPHLSHKFFNEEREIEKFYGLPEPNSSSF